MISPDKDCHLCDLCRKRTNLVLPTGDLGSPVVLVGEAPGENEDLQGKLMRMPEEARVKLRETLERIINEGTGGLICIIL